MARSTSKPKWIWIARQGHAEDVYLRARRTFTLRSRPLQATLRVAALGEYVLYVNGRYVGCGPAPSDLAEPLVDVYGLAELSLVRGRNVISVLAHNAHLGLPRRPRTSAGLWLRLDVAGPRGRPETIVTDRRWRVTPAEDFSRRAPRVYWTSGFCEVRDLRREPVGWTAPRFSERGWAKADEVRPDGPEGSGSPRPRDRSTPRLMETFVAPRQVVSAGRSRWRRGVTAVPFEFTVPDSPHGEFYAGTFVYSAARRRARLRFDCDEASAVYVNNLQAIRQGYREEFLRWLESSEQDEYTNIHRGQGYRAEVATVELHQGWNSVGVVIYDPGTSWGFAMRLDDLRTGRPLDLEFSPDMKADRLADWEIVKEQLCPCGDGALPQTPRPNARTFPDPAYQLIWETRAGGRGAARGASALLVRGKGRGPLVLGDGQFVLYDMGEEVVGYVELQVEGPPGAILDIAWAEGLDGGDLVPVNRGMRQADRLILRQGRQAVRLFNRRALRYLELVARTGKDALRIHRLGVTRMTSAAEPPAAPETGDRALADAMALVARTIQCCVQDTLEGSPARDQEQSIPAAFFLDQAERYLRGESARGEAALRAFANDQAGDGFFRAVVPAGTQHVVPDWNLLWIVWLADHVAWTGNRALAGELYPVAERVLDWTASFHGPTGLLENKPDRSPWWLFVDLSPVEKDGEVTAWQALYARALGAAADVAEAAGEEEAATHGRTEAEAVAKAARSRLWDPNRSLFVDSRHFEHLSRRASPATNYYALYGSLAKPEQAARILANLWADEETQTADWGPRENPFVKYFALETLMERGLASQALAMIRSYWGAMARRGLATVPEVFPPEAAKAARAQDDLLESPYGGPPPEVLCHGWGVHPAALVARWVLGVRPAGPGFEPLLVAPMPADLKRIAGRVWTPKGPVEIAIRRRPSRREVRVVVPEGIAYRLDRRHLDKRDDVVIVGGRPEKG